MMKCESCGKYYDYYKEESCPHCGAYNMPADKHTHACTAAELDGDAHVHRETFRLPTRPAPRPSNSRTSGTNVGTASRTTRPGTTSRPTASRADNSWGQQTSAQRRPSSSTNTVRQFERNENRQQHNIGKGKLYLLIPLIILPIVLPVVIGAVIGFNAYTSEIKEPYRSPEIDYPDSSTYSLPSTSSWGSAWREPAIPSTEHYTHDIGTPFQVSGMQLTIGEPKVTSLSDSTVPEDQWISIVSIPVTAMLTDEDEADATYPPDPVLYYNGHSSDVVTIYNYPQVVSAIGEDSLDLYDVQFSSIGTSMEGNFFFIVPTTELEKGLALGFDEMSADSSYTFLSYHEVAFGVVYDPEAPFTPSGSSSPSGFSPL